MPRTRFIVVVISIACSEAAAYDLIRCPDWSSLTVSEAASIPRSKPDFEKLAAAPSNRNVSPEGLQTSSISSRPLDAIGLLDDQSGETSVGAPAGRTGTCVHILQPGDTLSKIAASKLGSSARWSEIVRANPGIDPASLRVGQSINLPCGSGGSAAVAGPVVGVAAPVTGPAKSVDPTAAPQKAAVAVPPVPAPVVLPIWTARSGEYFSDVVKRWGKTAGYKVVFSTTADWTLAVPLSEQGAFEDVLDRVAKGLASNGRPPLIQLFPNKVLKIGGGA